MKFYLVLKELPCLEKDVEFYYEICYASKIRLKTKIFQKIYSVFYNHVKFAESNGDKLIFERSN